MPFELHINTSVMEKDGYLRVYDSDAKPEVVAKFLYEKNVMVNDLFSSKISLEEFYNKILGEETTADVNSEFKIS